MYAGWIVETGPAQELFSNPLHPYTQGLLECIPIPGKTQRGEALGSIPGIVPALVGENEGCMFRNRCPYAMDACAKGEIELRDMGHLRGYRCLLDPEQSKANVEKAAVAQVAQ